MGLFDIFSADTGPLKQGNAQFNKFSKKARKEITGGEEKALGYQEQGIAPFQALSDRADTGLDWYGRLLMGDGTPGSQNAYLEQTPGYQFALDQGLEGINRRRNSAGMLNSGNADIDAMKFASGLASQNYFNMLNAGQPYFGLGQGSAQGLANVYNNMGDTAFNAGTARANTRLGQASNAMQHGANLYTADQTGINNMWNAVLGLGSAAASAYGA